jgi:hyperosmotically inducible periplasmic protein
MNNFYTTNGTKLALAVALSIQVMSANATEDYVSDNSPITNDWQTPLASEFSRLDTTGNGLIMPNEASKNKAFNKKTFAKADADHDGTIDQNEFIFYKTGSWPVTTQSKSITNVDQKNDDGMDSKGNYSSTENMVVADTSSLGTVVDDSIITTKAKAEILNTDTLKSLQISVETHQGEVILSGFVDNEDAKMKAEEVVSKISGVKSVRNGLQVKS